MKKIFRNKHFRNALHCLVGAGLGYFLTLTFKGVPFLIQVIIMAFTVGGLGVFWEWGWAAYNRSKVDYKDVWRAVIPALLVLNVWVGLIGLVTIVVYYLFLKK